MDAPHQSLPLGSRGRLPLSGGDVAQRQRGEGRWPSGARTVGMDHPVCYPLSLAALDSSPYFKGSLGLRPPQQTPICRVQLYADKTPFAGPLKGGGSIPTGQKRKGERWILLVCERTEKMWYFCALRLTEPQKNGKIKKNNHEILWISDNLQSGGLNYVNQSAGNQSAQ